jgi:hypothetical protein
MKYQIVMVNEYKVLPPMDEKAIEAGINSFAEDGWKVFKFNRTKDAKYYALMVREKQKAPSEKR